MSSIVTYTGRVVDPLNLDPSKVNIIDIAHSLSLQCRFTGHVRFHYSVAQHSVLMVAFAEEKGEGQPLLKQLLLHDASEAYVADLARPVKHAAGLGDVYREVEDRVQAVVAERFGLPYPFDEYVHVYDDALLLAEQEQLMPRFRHIESKLKYKNIITEQPPMWWQAAFLSWYEELFDEVPRR